MTALNKTFSVRALALIALLRAANCRDASLIAGGAGATALALTTGVGAQTDKEIDLRGESRVNRMATRCISMSPASTATCCSPAKRRRRRQGADRKIVREIPNVRGGERRSGWGELYSPVATTPT